MVNRTRCKWRATIDVNSVCVNSWLGRSILYIIKVSQPKVHPGSVTIKGVAGEFFKGGSNIIEDGSLG